MADERYFKSLWKHDFEDEPVVIYMEIDKDNWVIRVIEEYRSGHRDIADEHISTGSTGLGSEPVPDITEIAQDKQFEPTWISKAAFESLWEASRKSLGV